MECPLRSNGDAAIFMWHSQKENGDAHVWHSHKDNGDTQDISVIFTQRKVGLFYSENETKSCGSPHKIRGMYEIKENKEIYSLEIYSLVYLKGIVWQSHKTKWDSSTGKLKDVCGSDHLEKRGDIHWEEKKYGSENLRYFR